MLKRNKKAIIIVAIIVAVLAITYLVANKTLGDDDDRTVGMVVKNDSAKVVEVEVQKSSGENLVITKQKLDDGSLYYSVKGGKEQDFYDQDSLSGVLFRAATMYYTYLVEEGENMDVEGYGLNDPIARTKVTLDDGSTYTYVIGLENEAYNGYYLMLEGGDTVYFCSSTYVSTILARDDKLMGKICIPEYEDPATDWKKLTYRPFGSEQTFTMTRMSDAAFAKVDNYSTLHKLTSPIEANVDESKLSTGIFYSSLSLTADSIIEDVSDEEMVAYGLTDPGYFEVVDFDGNDYKFLIGASDGEYTYIARDSDDIVVMKVLTEDLEVFNVNYKDIVSPLVWVHDINDLDSVEYNIDGKEYFLDITQINKEEFTISATLNGEDITESNAKRLYTRTIALASAGRIEDHEWGEVKYTIKINFENGNSRLMELAPINDRQYVIILDGEAVNYTTYYSIEYILEAFDIIAQGGDIPF